VAKSHLHELTERGQSVWFDTLSRDLVQSGGLKRMMDEDAVTGVTSNPTIFQKALAEGNAYDEQLKGLIESGDDPTQTFFALALDDIRDACDVLRPAYDSSGGVDGFVSMEVEPGIAYDTRKSFEQARWIASEVARPNLYVKIPATEAGLPAIEDCIAHGTPINITLIFSLQRYKAVVEAYLRGLERLVAGGGDPSPVVSVASFFVSRVDTEADKRLQALGRQDLEGKLAVANAKLAYQSWKEVYAGERWAALEAKGASKQWCLWASTSTKNPAYRDVMYVEDLIAPGVVNTMPESTIHAFAEHGELRPDTITGAYADAQGVLDRLAGLGIDYHDVVDTLEREGVGKFEASWVELVSAVDKQLGAVK